MAIFDILIDIFTHFGIEDAVAIIVAIRDGFAKMLGNEVE